MDVGNIYVPLNAILSPGPEVVRLYLSYTSPVPSYLLQIH